MISVFLVLGFALILFYRYLRYHYRMFERDGIPGPKPSYIFGSLKEFVGVDPLIRFNELVQTYGKVFGYFEGFTPSVVVSDPAVIEQILVKNFSSFDGRPNSYPLLHGPENLSLQNINGANWKQQRDALAPAFRTANIAKFSNDGGCSVLQMMPRIQATADVYIENLQRAQADNPQGFDVRSVNELYCLSSFTAAVFDEATSILPPEERDLFLQYMRAAHLSASPENAACGLARVYPALTSFLKLFDKPHKPLAERYSQFLSKLFTKERLKPAKSKEVGSVFQYLLSAHVSLRDHANNCVHVPLTENEMKGHMMGLLGGGVGTALSTLHFSMHCLAVHDEVQGKLRREVDAVCGTDSKDIRLDQINRMEYLDMFVNETLRHFPVAPGVARTCSEDCVVSGIQFRKGTVLRLLGSTQYVNPETYPDPKVFRPERFSKEERDKRHAYSWFPFGSGPRMCVAKRLGLLQVKMALVRLMQNFKLQTTELTHNPLPTALRPFLTPTVEVHLKLVRREREHSVTI